MLAEAPGSVLMGLSAAAKLRSGLADPNQLASRLKTETLYALSAGPAFESRSQLALKAGS